MDCQAMTMYSRGLVLTIVPIPTRIFSFPVIIMTPVRFFSDYFCLVIRNADALWIYVVNANYTHLLAPSFWRFFLFQFIPVNVPRTAPIPG
jgi:hypothetical protein